MTSAAPPGSPLQTVHPAHSRAQSTLKGFNDKELTFPHHRELSNRTRSDRYHLIVAQQHTF